MDLILKAYTPAPSKNFWHDPDPLTRGEWSDIYQIVSTWFCSSHTFNHQDNLVIIMEDGLIKLEGASIRYLGPSLRSAASLLYKAYSLLITLNDSDGIAESTPGVFVSRNSDNFPFPEPFYQLILGRKQEVTAPANGSLYCFDQNSSQEYYVPGSRISQGLVWYLQSR